MKPPKPVMPHAGLALRRTCECGNCKVCAVYAAADILERVWHDDTKKAKAVHDFINAIKEAAKE